MFTRTRWNQFFALAGTAVALNACTKASAPELGRDRDDVGAVGSVATPSLPAASPVVFSPGDVSSDVAFTPLKLIFRGVQDMRQLDDVAKLVRLRTYPELADVPIVTDAHPSAPDARAAVDGIAYIQVKPVSELADRWYILSLDTLVSGIRSTDALKPDPKLGAIVSRFRKDSAPVLWSVFVSSAGHLSLELSEGVHVKESDVKSFISVHDTSGKPCVLKSSGVAEGNFKRIAFDCDPQVWADKKVHITVAPGLASGSKKPLGIFNPSAIKEEDLSSQTALDADFDFHAAQPCDDTGLCVAFPPR